MAKIRIQKALAEAGVASRRRIEEMILEGRITVNGEFVAALPCFVDLEQDEVLVDGRPIEPRRRDEGHVYYLLNKPRGVVCTHRDSEGRPRAEDLVPARGRRVYCVGSLDAEGTGLILLTDDGDLTEFLTHRRNPISKTYVLEVDGRPTGEALEKLKRGMYLDARRTTGASVKVLRRGPDRTLLEVRIFESRNREVRRLLASLGHKVRRLKRTAIGPIDDRGLKIGSFRLLNRHEVERLRRSGQGEDRPPRGRQGE